MSATIKVVSKMKRAGSGSALIFKDNEEYQKYKAKLTMLQGDEFRMTVEPWDERREKELLRSEAQNRYYHKLLDIVCAETGDTHLELHDKLKAKFLGRPYVMNDKEYIIVPSTTSLNSKNFGEYLEKIFAFASEELGIVLPSPSDYY